MSASPLRSARLAGLLALVTVLLCGCVATVGGYGYGEGAAIVPDYYEPYGAVYGGWAPEYYVAPFRGGDRRFERGEERRAGRNERPSPTRAYRGAPASRAIPSIPSAPRSGGSHSGEQRH